MKTIRTLSALVMSAALEIGCNTSETQDVTSYVPIETRPAYTPVLPPAEYESHAPTPLPTRETTELSPPSETLKFPLVAIADEGTTLNPKKTRKVKKVVEYLFTKDKQPPLLSYDDSNNGWDALQRVEVVARISSVSYTITALNFSYTGTGSRGHEDQLSISISQKERNKNNPITFEDKGLDGHVDYMGPWSLSPFEEPVTLFGRTLPVNTRYAPRDTRVSIDPQLSKNEVADTLYTRALDRIIQFYENKSASSKNQ